MMKTFANALEYGLNVQFQKRQGGIVSLEMHWFLLVRDKRKRAVRNIK
jgi:acyl-ACP thioesterase